ncbi:MAG: hypothetical protein ABI835_19605, partial [Chloroflexota bacterium]
PLWAALTVFPLYALAKRFAGENARYAVIWWALVPAVIVFAGSWSTLYPLIAVVIFLLLVLGLEKARGWLILLSGVAFGVGVFVNFALIPLALMVGLYALGDVLLVQRRSILRAIIAGLWFGVGMVIPWLVYALASGETFFDLLGASMQFHLNLDRPYLFWVGMHLWDWLLWTGVGFAALGVAYLWRSRRERTFTPLTVLAGSLALTMLLLILSGTARGETGRVWLFFSPFLLMIGAGALRGTDHAPYGKLIIAQAVYAVALVASLNAMTTDLLPPPSAPVVSVNRPADATFSEGVTPLFRLTGWDAETRSGSIDLRLNWQGLSQTRTPYWFGVVLVSPDGEVFGRDPWQPGGAVRYPTTCWATQTAAGDEIRLELPPDAAPGDWWISLAAYPGNTADDQLSVTQPGQPPDQQIGLGPIQVTINDILADTH